MLTFIIALEIGGFFLLFFMVMNHAMHQREKREILNEHSLFRTQQNKLRKAQQASGWTFKGSDVLEKKLRERLK